MKTRLTVVAAALLAAGCSQSGPQGDSYFPLDVGARWEYDVASDISGTLTHQTYIASVDRTIVGSINTVSAREAELLSTIQNLKTALEKSTASSTPTTKYMAVSGRAVGCVALMQGCWML